VGRVRLAVWSPLPPTPSGIADYTAEVLPALARRAEVWAVVQDPRACAPFLECEVVDPEHVPDVDLHVYQLGNSPSHGYCYRAAIAQPGVVVLHEWSLHHLVLHETLERGDRAAYLREMRRAHGEQGTFVGRQVARALGGDMLPALYPLNERVLEGALGVVGLTRYIAGRAKARAPQQPVLHLPHHFSFPRAGPLADSAETRPTREQARALLGLPPQALLVTAPGLATAAKRIETAMRVVGRLRERWPALHLVLAGDVDAKLPLEQWAHDSRCGDGLIVTGRLSLEDFARHLIAADIVLALRFPSHGEISGALLRAAGIGRPCIVTGATPAAEEFPEGVVAPIDPGAGEAAQLEALLAHMLDQPDFRESMGRVAARYVKRHNDLDDTADTLVSFLRSVIELRPQLEARLEARRTPDGSLLRYYMDEIHWSGFELGLGGVPLGLEDLLTELTGPHR